MTGRKPTSRTSWPQLLRITALVLVTWCLLAWGLAHTLIVHGELKNADALAVLAGSDAYLERTQLAAQLFFQGRAPRIILTNDNLIGGWVEAEQRNPLFVERAIKELRRAGVPSDRIEVLSPPVSSTYEEAVLLQSYAATQKLHSLLVVTSAYHSRRALWILRRVFKNADVEISLAIVAPGYQSPTPATWWMQPKGWRIVALEYPKIFYYWVKYSQSG